MANTLAILKACVPEFDPKTLSDEGLNVARRWRQWLENFKCYLTFEGVTDPDEEPSKQRAALLAIGGQKLRELFSTLNPRDDTCKQAKDTLISPQKKNLTAERFKFFTSTMTTRRHTTTGLQDSVPKLKSANLKKWMITKRSNYS